MDKTDQDIDTLNTTVQSALNNASQEKFILKYRSHGVNLNVPSNFTFYKQTREKSSNTPNNFDNRIKSSHHPYLKRSPDQTRINNVQIYNKLQTNISEKINRKAKYYDISKIYDQKPKSKHVFAANCKVINLYSDINNYFVYWEKPPRSEKEKEKPIMMAEKKMYLGHLNLWYGGTLTTDASRIDSLQLYFECFKSKQNEGLTEIFIVCEDVEETIKDIIKVKVDGLQFKLKYGKGNEIKNDLNYENLIESDSNEESSDTNYADDNFETLYSEDDENTLQPKVGDEPVENDNDNTKTRFITVHLIEYDSAIYRGGSYIANSMGIISGLFVIAICAIFPR